MISKKTLIITGIIDDINLDCVTNSYIDARISEIKKQQSIWQITKKL